MGSQTFIQKHDDLPMDERMDKMQKYLAESDVTDYLAEKLKFGFEEQRKNRCDDQQDAYWQGWIDLISILADDYDLDMVTDQ